MTFDSEEHKNLVMELVLKATFTGSLVPLVNSLIVSIEKASVKESE